MEAEKNLILDKKKLTQLIKRMAYQIFEENYLEKEIVIAGIYEKGYYFAELLAKELQKFEGLQVKVIKVEVNKTAKVQPEVTLDVELAELKNKVIVVTDDVLNTGRAITFGLRPFLNIPFKKLQTAVIVKRNHKVFPVSTDYVGYTMATTLKEHVEVKFEAKDFGVYLH